tara:strand:+ start:144 stop:428 length:285 start_codon:yes stop_codon:yes gene_type:complete
MELEATIIFDCPLDKATIEQIDDLRRIRLDILQEQSRNPQTCAKKLQTSDDPRLIEALVTEIEGRIDILKSRLEEPNIVYVDELETLINLLNLD